MLSSSLLLNEAIARRSKSGKVYAVLSSMRRKSLMLLGRVVIFENLPFLASQLIYIWLSLTLRYRNITAVVQWHGPQSREFRIHQGVRQGGKDSPLLYNIFINDLLLKLQVTQGGFHISTTSIACPTRADDLLLT